MTPLLYVITTKTKDYGETFVVRQHLGGTRSQVPTFLGDTLEAARAAVRFIRPDLVRLERIPVDDAVLVESWGPADYVAELRDIQRTLGW